MHSPSAASSVRQQFIPLLPDSANRTRQHSAPTTTSLNSIWAPQPQPPSGTWPQPLFSLGDTNSHLTNLALHHRESLPAMDERPLTKEDVFGPMGGIHLPQRKEIGVVGDGRQKEDIPSEPNHVEQLLRSLNLNSPVPVSQISPSAYEFDVSPSASSSFPPTPVEASPTATRSTDNLFHKLCELNSAANPGHMYPPQQFTAQTSKGMNDPCWNDLAYACSRNFNRGQNMPQVVYQSPVIPDPSPESRTLSVFPGHGPDHRRPSTTDWGSQSTGESREWPQMPVLLDSKVFGLKENEYGVPRVTNDDKFRMGNPFSTSSSWNSRQNQQPVMNEPINFLSLLHPSSSPPYALFVARIVKSSDQQASIFLQQKLKVADDKERGKIIDAICTKGTEMMSHRFGNWAVQRCLEAASTAEERRKIAACMRGNVVELATNCYGCHVLQKALDCEEDIRLLIVSELLLGDPAKTLINKHASHVWSKIMELSWTPPAPPIFAYVNKALQSKWASLACHETGSLVVQHAFENLEESAKDGIVDELLNHGPAVFAEVCKNQWGSYCIQHILEHGSPKHKELALSHLLMGLLEFATSEQGFKSVAKALKEGGRDALNKFVDRMRESPAGGRRAIIVDLALSTTGSQFIASVLPNVDKDQRALLYDAIRGHIVTLRGCKTGSKVIWLFDRMV